MGVSYEDWEKGTFSPGAMPPPKMPKTYEEWENGGPVGQTVSPTAAPVAQPTPTGPNSPQLDQSRPNSPQLAPTGPAAQPNMPPPSPQQQLEQQLPKPAFVKPEIPGQPQPPQQQVPSSSPFLDFKKSQPQMGIPGAPKSEVEPAQEMPPVNKMQGYDLDNYIRNEGKKYVKKFDENGNPESYDKDIPKPLENAMKMLAARKAFAGKQESFEDIIAKSSMPYASAGARLEEAKEYHEAKKRIEQGDPKDADFDAVAKYERNKQAQSEEGFGRGIFRAAAALPAIAGEAVGPGKLFKGASVVGKAVAGILSSPFMPSLYADKAIEDNLEAGRAPNDPVGLPKALAVGAMTNAVIGSLNGVAGNIGGGGVGGFAKRTAVRAGTGIVEQAAVDVVAGAAGLQNGYGVLHDIASGKIEDGLKHLASQAIIFGGMSALHGDERSHQAPKEIIESFNDTLKDYSKRGDSREVAAEKLKPAFEVVQPAIEGKVSPQEAKAKVEQLPEGPAKDFAEKVIEHLPESKRNENATEPPIANAPAETGPNSPQLAPTGPNSPEQAGSDVSQKVEKPFGNLSVAKDSESQTWQHTGTKFAENKAGDLTFKAPGGEELTVGGKSGVGGISGKPYADVIVHDAKGNELGKVTFDRAEDKGGDNIAARFLEVDPSLRGKDPETVAKRRAVVDAMYDFMHEQAAEPGHSMSGKIVPSSKDAGGNQTKGGQSVWQRNAELAEKLKPGGPEPEKAPMTAEEKKADRLERMRQKQSLQGEVLKPKPHINVLRPEGRLPEPVEPPEPTRPQDMEEYPGVRYEHIPPEVRQRTDRILEGLPAEEKATAMNSFREAFGEGGVEGVHELLGIHEDMNRPEQPGEKYALLKELNQLTKELGDDAEKSIIKQIARELGIEPKALRRASKGSLRKATSHAEAATKAEAAREPTEGQREASEPASAERDQAAADRVEGSKENTKESTLSPIEKATRAKYKKQFSPTFERAAEMGLDEDTVHQVARELFNSDKEGFKVRDQTVKQAKKEAYDQLKGFGISRQRIARQEGKGGDAAFIKGFDQVAQSLADRGLVEVRPDENPSDSLWRMLTEPEPKPVKMEQAYEQALEYLEQTHEAALQTSPAENEAAQALARQGFKASEIAEALRAGQEDGFRESFGGEGELPEGHEGEGAEAGEGESERGDSWEPAPGERAADAGERDPWDDIAAVASGEPIGAPGAKLAPMREIEVDQVGKAIQDMATQEAGHINLSLLADVIKNKIAVGKSFVNNTVDSMNKFAGQMYPKLTRLSRESAEALTRAVSAKVWAQYAAPYFTEKVLGENATPEASMRVGTAQSEMRQRKIREVAQAEAAKQSKIVVDANNAMKTAKTPEERANLRATAQAAAERLNQEAKIAREAQTFIGQPNSPFQSEQEYQQYINGPEFKGVQGNYGPLAKVMDANFRLSQGMMETDPINAPSQIPGMPINLKSMAPGEQPGKTTIFPSGAGMKGNVQKLRPGRNIFAKRATGASEGGYDTDFARMVEHSLSNSAEAATRAEAIRTLVREGIAKWDEPFKKDVMLGDTKLEEFRDVKPPPGTQEAQRGQTSLYLHPDAADDVRQALVEHMSKNGIPDWVKAIPNTANKIALMSTVEAAFHAANLGTMMFNPRMGLVNLAKNAIGVIKGSPEVEQRIMDLAKEGSMKSERMGLSGWNPKNWGAKFLGFMQHTIRLTADDAYTSMVKSGDAVDTPTARRNFINQTGQYNIRAQNRLVQIARNSGLGPFATAGTNFTMSGLQSVVGGSGVETTGLGSDIKLRAEKYARIATIGGAVAMANYLKWGRADGDDKTPLGALKVGEKDGRSEYIDLFSLTGVPRGMKMLGLGALFEGLRSGKTGGQIFDKAVKDFVGKVTHPFEGPIVNVANIALAGKNAFGMPAADKAKKGDSQIVQNLIAVAKNANPAIKTGLDYAYPKKGESDPTKLTELLGPFGIRESAAPPRRKGGLKGLRRLGRSGS